MLCQAVSSKLPGTHSSHSPALLHYPVFLWLRATDFESRLVVPNRWNASPTVQFLQLSFEALLSFDDDEVFLCVCHR